MVSPVKIEKISTYGLSLEIRPGAALVETVPDCGDLSSQLSLHLPGTWLEEVQMRTPSLALLNQTRVSWDLY